MKKIIMIIAIVAIAVVSCKKEEITINKEISKIEQNTNTKEQVKDAQPAFCTTANNGLGWRCELSFYSSSWCPNGPFSECCPVGPCGGIIERIFTPVEIEKWKLGIDFTENTSKFYIDHYEYYLYLHNTTGKIVHPDIIIKDLKSKGL